MATQAEPLPSWLPQLQGLAQSQAPAPFANPTYSLQAGHHSACCKKAVGKKQLEAVAWCSLHTRLSQRKAEACPPLISAQVPLGNLKEG